MAKITTKRRLTARQKQDAFYRRYLGYWRQLGHFADNFARIETVLQVALMQHCKISDDVRRAIFSGTRVDGAISLLRRLADVGQIDPAEWEGMKLLLTQVSIINERRNAILHYGGGTGVASNEFTALLPDRATAYPISIPILRQMTDDLGLIFFLFSGEENSPHLSSLVGLTDVPWKYRPQPLKKNQRPQGGKSAARQRQPPSSRE